MTASSTATSGTDSASATAGASGAGSGPSGGGTASQLPDAPASDVSGASDAAPERVVSAAEHLALALSASGIAPETLIEAARAVNSQAAPADSINQKLDGLHTRITQIEASTNEALSLAHAFAPFVQKLRHLFDVHFGGKLG